MTRDEFRKKFGGPGVSDDDAILRYFAGTEFVEAMRAAASLSDYTGGKNPLLMLIEHAARQDHSRQVYIRQGNVTIRLEKRTSNGAGTG